MKRIAFLILLALLAMSLVGCGKTVETDEVGVVVSSGEIEKVRGPGWEWNFSWWRSTNTYSTSNIHFQAYDPQILTKAEANDESSTGIGQSLV